MYAPIDQKKVSAAEVKIQERINTIKNSQKIYSLTDFIENPEQASATAIKRVDAECDHKNETEAQRVEKEIVQFLSRTQQSLTEKEDIIGFLKVSLEIHSPSEKWPAYWLAEKWQKEFKKENYTRVFKTLAMCQNDQNYSQDKEFVAVLIDLINRYPYLVNGWTPQDCAKECGFSLKKWGITSEDEKKKEKSKKRKKDVFTPSLLLFLLSFSGS